DRPGGIEAEPARAARPERHAARHQGVLVERQAVLRPRADQGAGADRARGVGPGPPQPDAARGLRAADVRALSPAGGDRRRHPHRDHGEEPRPALHRGPALPGRAPVGLPNPYDTIAARYAGARKPWLEQRYLPGLIEGLAPGERVLDLGCGAGLPITERLTSAGLRVVGVDSSIEM